MIHAYDESYLAKARVSLGRMLDFSVNDLKYNLQEYYSIFLASEYAERFGRGDFQVLAGMSGVELTYAVLESINTPVKSIRPMYTVERSKEYWTGWALAYYQWKTSLRFSEINRYVPITTIRGLYSPYHEMDIRQFCDRMDELYKSQKIETNLKIIRRMANLSQDQLSKLSGVPVRTIQQYEQRQKNINKAQVECVIRLSRALCCDVNDLIEKVE